MVFGLMGSMIHVAPMEKLKGFVSTRAESIMAGLVTFAWISGLPVINAPANDLAVSSFHVVNANLYFASWGSFFLSAVILINMGWERGYLGTSHAGSHQWLFLAITSVIALGTSSRILQNTGCTHPYEPPRMDNFCHKLDLGITLSSIAAVLASFMVILNHCAAKVNMLAGLVALAVWSIALAELTFGNSPGNHVGNLFFSTWISFILSMDLAATHLRTYLNDPTTVQEFDDNNAAPVSTLSLGALIDDIEADNTVLEPTTNARV